MSTSQPVFRSAFTSSTDEANGMGRRPVVLDVLGPDWETSLLPDDLKMVLHVNPTSMSIQMNRQVERIQTRGGYVEQHWGDSTSEISFDQSTGGFMRLYGGLSNVTNPSYGGTRRETIAYDKYLDLLALFKHNGSVYDTRGNVVLQGILKLTFDGGVYLGWFQSFSVVESADKPYQFVLNSTFTVDKESVVWRSTLMADTPTSSVLDSTEEQSQTPTFDMGTTTMIVNRRDGSSTTTEEG